MQEHIQQFKEEGFIVIPNAVPKALLTKLQQFFDALITDPNYPHKASSFVKGNYYTTNIDKLMDKDNLACLELLGTPVILELAAALCGPDFFMIQEFGVIKMLGDTTPVLWHQDMLHQRTGTCITMGIYLDAALEKDGALQVVPKSHLSKADICTLKKEPFIEVPMQPGDLLIHDMMLAHSSEPLQHNKLRRVLYFEFLPASQALNEQIYTKEIVQNRFHLLQVAIQYHKMQNPETESFNWQNTLAKQPINDVKRSLEEINQLSISPKTSAYCLQMA
jgi:ectoine hydroxylase-related dioxygenase (phytanoyl-CoA dioxygenase family)